MSSIIFIDSPVGTGFSYGRTPLASQTGLFKKVRNLLQFLRKVKSSYNFSLFCVQFFNKIILALYESISLHGCNIAILIKIVVVG